MSTMKIGTKDSKMPGGLESLRVPVAVGVRKRKKKSNGQDARSTGDPHQVKRVTKPKIVRGPHWNDNNLVYLTGLDLNTTMPAEDFGVFLASLIETADPSDRAHTHRRLVDEGMPKADESSWVLLSPVEIDHPIGKNKRRTGKPKKTTRRRYHPSQLTSRGVAFDSMYDRVFAIAKDLQSSGVSLGWTVGREGDFSNAEQDRAKVLAGMNAREARAVFTQTTSHAMSKEERDLEDRATALLSRQG